MNTFEDYKKQIDLSEYAQRQGWQVDAAKSTAKAVVLDRQQEGVNQDTIVVYKGKEHDYFYTPNHAREKGDIINFERIKNNADWKEINDKLASYVGEVKQQRQAPEQMNSHSHNEAFQHNFRFQPLTNSEYLESRGIGKETIYADEFKDRVFNREFSYREYLQNNVNQLGRTAPMTQSDKEAIQQVGAEKYYSKPFFEQLKSIQEQAKETHQLPNRYLESLQNTYGYKGPEGATDRVIVNTSFPLRNEESVVAAINRNNDYNRIEQPKGNAVWSSKTDFDARPVTNVVVHESPIDSMSYHQLNPPKQDEKRLYIATAGNMSNEQPVLIEKLVREANAQKVILANDNDPAGIKQNINLAGRLNLSEKSENIHAHLNVHDRTDGRLLITITHQTQQEGQARVKEVADRFTSAINKNIPPGAEQEAKATILQNGTRSSEVEITFTVNRENLIRIERTLVQERGLEKNIQIQRPYEKDYNEDLKKATPFVVAYQENGKEQIAGRYAKEIDAHQAVSEKAQEKPQAQIVAYMEMKNNQESKRVELAQYDRETNKVVATPEFEKRVEEQQKQYDNQQRAQAAASQANAGNVKMVDGDGNTVAKTDYKVEIDSQGHATVRKEQRFDQEELTREGTNGKDLQNAMNKEVANASGQGAGQGGAALKDPHKDINQEQGNKRSMSM